MTTVKALLRELELGNSVAEFDSQLESYFVETQPFRELVRDKRDIIAGDKGTGKTALFKVLHRRYSSIPELRHIVVIPAFNPTGSPIFQELASRGRMDEGEYIKLWKAFILSLVGNWILKHNKAKPKSNLAKLDQLLVGLDMRSENDSPQPVFRKILDRIGGLFNWKSAEFEIKGGADGLSFKPKIAFDKEEKKIEVNVSVEDALRLLNDCLEDINKTVWVALDRLDEAFQGYPDIEIPALRALFRSYLDLIAFDRIKLKLFVRRDLFGRIIEGGFVNLSHVHARKIDVIWDEEDLLNLLCRRIHKNEDFVRALGLKNIKDKEVFYKIFPDQVDQGSRKPDTWVWMMGRIRDGKGIKPPRNLIDLVSMAKDAQLRREEREPREHEGGKPIVEPDALRRALAQLSEQRVNDTLLAEARDQAPLVDKFRRGKAEHNEESLSKVLGVFPETIRLSIKPLVELGFLEEVGGTYKIPMLYRGGLEITQGKAFDDRVEPEEED